MAFLLLIKGSNNVSFQSRKNISIFFLNIKRNYLGKLKLFKNHRPHAISNAKIFHILNLNDQTNSKLNLIKQTSESKINK